MDNLIEMILPYAVAVIIAAGLISMAIKVIPEYERAVLFRLGRLVSVRGPGLIFIIPFIDRIRKVSLRIVVDDVPPQEVITRDNVTCRVNAILYYRVTDPDKAIVNVENFHDATSQFAQTTMRSVVGQAYLDELLSNRTQLNKEIQEIVDLATDPWGIKVTAVELRDVTIPVEMQRAMARQAESERSRRAVVIQAEGEKQVARKIAQAAQMLNRVEGAMALRMLRTISEASSQDSNTILFPLPMNFTHLFGQGEPSGGTDPGPELDLDELDYEDSTVESSKESRDGAPEHPDQDLEDSGMYTGSDSDPLLDPSASSLLGQDPDSGSGTGAGMNTEDPKEKGDAGRSADSL